MIKKAKFGETTDHVHDHILTVKFLLKSESKICAHEDEQKGPVERRNQWNVSQTKIIMTEKNYCFCPCSRIKIRRNIECMHSGLGQNDHQLLPM